MVKPFIETLRAYAREPYPENPPELLPWDSDAPWSIDDAARRTLGLLVAGEQPGPRLWAHADYLVAFISPADRSTGYPDALLLNGTALALIGYLSEGRHPEAEIWRLSGSARLVTMAHERRAALEDKAVADCVLAVCQVADELGAPLLADLISLRERMWGRLLDHTRAERIQVISAEYARHMHVPLAPDALGGMLRARPWQIAARDPDYLMELDMQEAEETCRNLITIRAHMLVKHQFGNAIDWHLRLFNDIESNVGLNGIRFIRNLAAAYEKTGDEKYAENAARLLWSWYNANPVPNHKEIMGPWRTLETGTRQWRVWVDVIGYLGQSAPFDDALHAMLACSRLDHLRYATAFTSWPNNWYQVEASGVAVSAIFSPELKQADAYLRIALRRLKWINSFAYYDDGFQFELTHGYHMFPTNAIFAVVQAAKARQVSLPADFVTLAEKAHEMYLFATQPNHLLPTFNDCNAIPADPAPTLRFAAEIFERRDFLWGGTYGRQGQAPDHASHAWPFAKLYAMRDKWGEDGQFLFFDGAAWGASHQHEDKLTFIIYSHGRLLIGDPNIYSYSPTELTHYFKSSRAHNLIMIDGMGQARRYDPKAILHTEGRNEWVSHPDFDFVSSEYLEGYAPDPFPGQGDATQVVNGFSQRRAMFYIKPGYWIVCDLVKGPDGAAHKLEQLFHLAPLYRPEDAIPLAAGEVSIQADGVRSANAGAANIAILPVDPASVQARAQKGETSPAVGWYGVLGEFPAWDVTFERATPLPARMDAVLFPLASGTTAAPSVKRLRQDKQVTAFSIQGAGVDDLFILCEEGCGPVKVGDVTFQGRALLLRRNREKALAVEPVEILVAGKKIATE
jgi:hypothetical protein